MTTQRTSLFADHPKRWDIPLLMALTTGLLITGLSLPFLGLKKLVFWEDDYTLFTSVQGLWGDGQYVLATVIFFFSIVFPFSKLVALGLFWFMPTDAPRRRVALHWISVLGKWSMLDVFVVAMIIVLSQAKAMVDASPRSGLYIFAAAILLSMILSLLIERVAQKRV